MANVGDSNWSLGASIGSLGSTSSTPRLCTHREMYRRSGGGSTDPMSPRQPSPSVDSGVDSPPPTSSWSPKDRDRHNPVDVAHIRLRPEIKPDLPPSVPNNARELLLGYSLAHHPSNHRSVNEELDKYMVIKQRSFHGYARSKHDLRQLPQTDPREDMDPNPNWLHRSKTDLYIERRRAKLASQRARRRSGSGGYSLDGITLGSLMNQLPVPVKRDHNGHNKLESRNVTPGSQTGGGPSETRFPPLTMNRMKQMIRNDSRSYSLDNNTEHRRPFTTNALPISSTTFPVPDPPPNSPPQSNQETTVFKRGRLRKQPVDVIPDPLMIWEPTLDYVLRSNSKELQPRPAVRSFAHKAAMRHQPSPLK